MKLKSDGINFLCELCESLAPLRENSRIGMIQYNNLNYESFVVDESGNVVDTKIERGIGYGMDEMLASVINNLPDFSPAMQNNQIVKVRLMLPVKFELR